MKPSSAHDLTIAIYNPDWLGKDELIQQFVVRQSLFDRVAADLRTATPETGSSHHLLVGQRGMGKTTFLRRLRYAVEDDPELSSRWMALAFPEDQYNVARLSNFWLNCLDALSDALERRSDRAASQRIDQCVNDLTGDDEGALAQGALEMLLTWCRENDRGLVLLVDNIDLILDRLDRQQHWQLRETLSHESRITIVGSSVTPPTATFQYQDAFYDFFQVHELRGLTRDEARRLLVMLAERGGTPHVTDIVESEPGRLATLHLLTGGNPRTLILLYQVLAASEEGNVIQDVEHLLDQSTPLYKARVEALAPQAQQVFDQLALNWDPATAADLAAALRMEVNKVSTQLDRLVRDGVVEKVLLPPATKTGFQVSERFFNIWYLMRGSRRVRRRLIWLVEFLKLFYGSRELAGQARRWLEKWPFESSPDRSRHTELALAFASAVEEPTLSRMLERHGVQVLMEMTRELRLKLEDVLELDGGDAHLQPITNHLKTLREIRDRILSIKREWPDCTAEEFWDLFGGSISLTIEGKKRMVAKLESLPTEEIRQLVQILQEEYALCSRIFGSEPCRNLWEAIRSGRMLNLVDVVGADEASFGSTDTTLSALARAAVLEKGFSETEFDQLENLLPKCQSAYAIVAWARFAVERSGMANKVNEAIKWFTELNPINADSWDNLGGVLQKLSRYAEAEAAYRQAIELDPKKAVRWVGLGILLQEDLCRYAEAEAAYRQAIELNPKLDIPWNALGNLLQEHLSRYVEAEAAYRQAIELDPKYAIPWNNLGILLQDHLSRYAEAEAAYREAIELDPKYALPWINLGNLLQKHLSRYPEAEAAYRQAIELNPKDAIAWNNLGNLLQDHVRRYTEAEGAYRQAIELDPKYAGPWNNLGNLLQKHLSRYAEAEAAYRQAIELDPKYPLPWVGLGNLLQQHLGRYAEAEVAYRQAIELDPKDSVPWSNLGSLLKNHLSRYAEAEAAYRQAIELNPKDADTWVGLGNLLQQQLRGNAEAEGAFRHAVELAPKDARIANCLAWHLFVANGDIQEAKAQSRRALTMLPVDLHMVHTLACIVLRCGNWPEAAQLARQFIVEGTEIFFQETWADILLFFREAVNTGHGREAAELLDETGFGERWRPLREALHAAALGEPDYLLRLAPEVRLPAQELLPLLLGGNEEGAAPPFRRNVRRTKKASQRNSRRRRQ